jgi:beta-lactamase regulating signal transducer with metallopeptidase domain
MSPWIETTGWTLIHFAWQGTLLALGTAAALRLCRASSPQARYLVACLGLAAMAGAVAATALAGGRALFGPLPAAYAAASGGLHTAPTTAPADAVATHAFAAPAGVSRALNPQRLLPALVRIWLAGVTLLIARLAGGCWRIRRLRTAMLPAPRSSWQPSAERLARRLCVAVPFRLVESAIVDAPMVIGWLRPLIVLPLAVLANLTAAQVEALIAHELAHIRRRDYAVNLLQTAAEALLFFHPGVWWVSRRIRQEREHCCDDAAIDVAGEVTAYVEALATLATLASGRHRRVAPSVGAADGSLLLRIRRLLGVPRDDRPAHAGGMIVFGAGVVLAAAVFVLSPASPATAQPPAQSNGDSRHVRQTDHFDVHYPAALDLHAERIVAEAERAYEHVSGDLRHNLGFKVSLLLFPSGADLQRGVQELASDRALNGAGQSEHIMFAVDRPADQWLGLLTHEVAHVFGFDIMPGGTTPAWIMEGLAEYERNTWDPDDLVMLRAAIRANTLPRVTAFLPEASRGPRFVDALGHAAFDFIESRWGKAGVRQFLLAVRRSGTGGGDPYQAAFHMSGAEFDQAFESYLRTRLRDGVAAAVQRFDPASTVQIEGVITTITVPTAAGLACIELLVPAASGAEERWGIECGEARAADLVASLKPGQHVVITGRAATTPGLHRLSIRSVLRSADGFEWRVPG